MLMLSSKSQNSVVVDRLTNGSHGIVYLQPMKLGKGLFAGVVTARHEDGMPPYRKQIEHGLIDGLWNEWYADGGLKCKANREKDRRHAFYKYFHNNGRLRQKEFYVEDQPVGIQAEYDAAGQIAKRILLY